MAEHNGDVSPTRQVPVDVEESLRRLFPPKHAPESWFLVAVNLMECAEVLRERFWRDGGSHNDPITDYRYGPVYTMLVGFAMENMLKGLAIAADPCLVKPKLAEKLRTHDLGKLWTVAKMGSARRQPPILRRMTDMVKTFGRYPVPLSENDMVGQLGAWLRPDFSAIEWIWKRVCCKGKEYAPDWTGWEGAR